MSQEDDVGFLYKTMSKFENFKNFFYLKFLFI